MLIFINMVGDMILLRGTWKSQNIDRKIGLVLDQRTKTVSADTNWNYVTYLIYVPDMPLFWISELAVSRIFSLGDKDVN